MAKRNDVERVETPPRTSLKQGVETSQEEVKQGDTELKQDVETEENSVSPTVLNDMIHLRLKQGLSFREIAKRKKCSLSMVGRVLKGVGMEEDSTEADVDPDETDESIDGEVSSHISLAESPTNYVLRPGATPEEFQRYMKMKKEDLISENLNLKAQNASLQGVAQTRGNGEGHNNGYGPTSADEELKRAEAETEREYGKTLRDQRMRERLGPNNRESESIRDLKQEIRELRQSQQTKSDPVTTTKMMFEAFTKGMDFASPKAPTDPTALVWKAVETVEKIQERVNNPSLKNEFDLKLEEMRGSREIDNRKIDHEERVWEYEKEHSGDTLNAAVNVVKEITSGPIGKLISGAGEGVRDRISGANPSLIEVQCPSCSHKFKVNKTLPKVQCPNCAMMLQAVAPGPTPQPQEPQTETPKPEPQPPEEIQKQEPELDRWSPQEREAYRNGEKTDKKEVI